MTFNLDGININLQNEDRGIRLTSILGDNQLLANVTICETENIIAKNYDLVKKHYKQKVGDKILSADLENVSIKIVLHYFYMYQLWRTIYNREKNRDLTFLEKDFSHPYTADKIIFSFKKNYPDSYRQMCEIMLDMNTEQFEAYEKSRQDFYDK